VVWIPAFVTAHAVIDAQHKGLVAHYNFLLATIREAEGEKKAQEEALHTFIGAMVAHFGIEEALMAEGYYPDAREHRAVHALLTNQIQDLALEPNRGLVES